MTRETAFDRLGRELEHAAARQLSASAAGLSPRRRWRGHTLAVAIAAVGVGAGGAAWAATSLLSSRAPVPFERGAPIAGRAQGAPIHGTVKLTTTVADPDGGPLWGLRYWETDRRFACVQVGRIYAGKLGQISDDKTFHELRLGVTSRALGGCFALDGGGHAFVAIHTDARRGAQPPNCVTAFAVGARLPGPDHRLIRCEKQDRTVDFGLLGPNAGSVNYRADEQDRSASPSVGTGAYLVVQKRLRPVIREFGFHHRDPKLNLRGPAEPYIALTPGSQVIKRITYNGGTCVVHVTSAPRGACDAEAGFVPIPPPRVGDVRSLVRASTAPNGRRIRVRFRARQAVVDGRSGYDIEVRPIGGRGFMTQTYSRNVAAGDLVRITVGLYNRRRGPYRIVVRYRTVGPRPGPYASLAYPGLLVGQKQVEVP